MITPIHDCNKSLESGLRLLQEGWLYESAIALTIHRDRLGGYIIFSHSSTILSLT